MLVLFYTRLPSSRGFPDGSGGKESPCSAGDVRDMGSIPESGRSPGGGHGNSLQYSCLENSMDREAQGATVHRVTWSRTQNWGTDHSIFLQASVCWPCPTEEALGAPVKSISLSPSVPCLKASRERAWESTLIIRTPSWFLWSGKLGKLQIKTVFLEHLPQKPLGNLWDHVQILTCKFLTPEPENQNSKRSGINKKKFLGDSGVPYSGRGMETAGWLRVCALESTHPVWSLISPFSNCRPLVGTLPGYLLFLYTSVYLSVKWGW